MLRGVITTTRLATITVIEHHHQSKSKMFSQQRHKFKEKHQFATPVLRVALTQSHHLARRITRDAKNLRAKAKTLVEISGDFFGLFGLGSFC